MELTVALGQMEIATGRPDLNMEAARDLTIRAADQGAHLLMLPELWPTGYDLDRAEAYAVSLGAGPFSFMAELAKEFQVYLVGTALELNPDGRPFNTAALYGPDGGLAGVYRKAHLIPLMGEVEHMTPGGDLPVFDLPWGRTALAICYDLRFPEMWRVYVQAGARLILIPSEWPVPRIGHWRLLLRARAVENQLFVAGCNRAGAGADGEFGGHSAAIDPWGRVLVDGGAGPGLYVALLDLDEVTRMRQQLPFLEDRRADLYG